MPTESLAVGLLRFLLLHHLLSSTVSRRWYAFTFAPWQLILLLHFRCVFCHYLFAFVIHIRAPVTRAQYLVRDGCWLHGSRARMGMGGGGACRLFSLPG